MTEPAEPPPPPPVVKKYTAVDYVFQFVTVTAGVLIALLINGLVEWNRDRALVAQARQTIAQEIADNRADLDRTLASMADDAQRLENAMKFARDLLTRKRTAITELKLHVNLADLSSTGWHAAERTGALSHMPYAEVQRYSKLYDLQDLYMNEQRTLLARLGAASAILSGDFDPDNPNVKDLETFRERLMELRSVLNIHEQMGRRLSERYAEALRH